ncbi:MAG: peptide chain release factor N(5)-glutamine methyltransferase [Lactobacillaceae bacterium]|jgi:release factor glutamine methyltransferase|nr:peptide chain release factor N(5)-glutamine methyltransferase [Lactobacillaceae bacterium]
MALKLDDIISEFVKAGITSPRLEAVMLIENAKNDKELASFVEERLASKPICKIIGKKDFYKHTFKVSEDVLSPRPDTETLVECAIEIIKKNKIQNILELGVGSGCIILSVLYEFGNIRGVGMDISNKAIDIAQENAKNIGVAERISFVNKSWFDDDIKEVLNKKFDIIISNPPYIVSSDISVLDREVKDYDPLIALDGGTDGLRDYRQIASVSGGLLNDNGYILLEVGLGQSKDVSDIFIKTGFELIDTVKDLAGIDRCIILKK